VTRDTFARITRSADPKCGRLQDPPPVETEGETMRRNRRVLAVAGLAVVAVLVTAAIALGSGRRELTSPVTIRVQAVGGHAVLLPLNPNKKSFFGDEFVINAPLFKLGTHDRAGQLHAQCTFMDKAGVAAECTGTFFLHGGKVVVHGPVDFGVKNRTSGAVVGGSGGFRNTRGQVIFLNSTGNTEGFILQLQP
jgi:hypothetical protein